VLTGEAVHMTRPLFALSFELEPAAADWSAFATAVTGTSDRKEG
jgi:hypothetical protein